MKRPLEFFRKEYLKAVLERLYNNYPYALGKDELSKDVMGKKEDEDIDAVCRYLGDKGLIVGEVIIADKVRDRWRITASGIDYLEGKSLV